jgi:hypothetical protein
LCGRVDWLLLHMHLGRLAWNITLVVPVLTLLSWNSPPRCVPLALGPSTSPTLARHWRNAKSFFAYRRQTWRCERQFW